jgi:Predicted pPIWI-associating nuclease
MRFSIYDIKIALLQCFASQPKGHRGNVLGRPHQEGTLEHQMGIQFTPEERGAAQLALGELEQAGLVRATHADIAEPFNWLEITDAGRRALEVGALEDIDHWLRGVDPQLIEIRHGAWAAAYSSRPDTLRQGAHSGRELIRLVLDRVAPDADVRAAPWFHAQKITRRDRIKYVMEKRRGRVSESTLRIIEVQCDVVEASYQRLSMLAHSEIVQQDREQLKDLLRAAEAALRDLLRPKGEAPP